VDGNGIKPHFTPQHCVNAMDGGVKYPQTGSQLPLGVQINHHHLVTKERQGMTKICGYGGFPDATLLVDNRNTPHSVAPLFAA
jgi:hypothetical protein